MPTREKGLYADYTLEFVGLELNEWNDFEMAIVESFSKCSDPVEPTIYGVPIDSFNPRDRRTAHAFDAQVSDAFEVTRRAPQNSSKPRKTSFTCGPVGSKSKSMKTTYTRTLFLALLENVML